MLRGLFEHDGHRYYYRGNTNGDVDVFEGDDAQGPVTFVLKGPTYELSPNLTAKHGDAARALIQELAAQTLVRRMINGALGKLQGCLDGTTGHSPPRQYLVPSLELVGGVEMWKSDRTYPAQHGKIFLLPDPKLGVRLEADEPGHFLSELAQPDLASAHENSKNQEDEVVERLVAAWATFK